TTENMLHPPECTTLSNPLAGAINVPIDTDFNWNAVPNATGYRINIGTNSIFFGEFDVGNALTYDLAFDLPENTEIYVRIIPYNIDGDALGGCTYEIFTTGDDLVLPPCTTLSSPISGATNVSVSTDLTWNTITEATGYLLNVGTTSGGSEILNAFDVGNVFSFNLTSDLPENTLIYVSIIPYNADGNAIGCTEEIFTTEDILFPPDCTTLNAPISGSINVLVGTDLTWNSIADATGYILTIGTTSGGSDILNTFDVGNVTTYNLDTDLPDNTVIYVSVIPYNLDGEATSCTEESFSTEDLLFPPNCTSLFSPTSGSTDVLIDTDLIWEFVPEATGYVLTVGTTSGGTDILNGLDVGSNLSYDLANNLPEDTLIYVTLIPYNEDGEATGCNEESFATQSSSDRIPKFFTPNNDDVNDNWVVPNELNVISEIIIFNRYGKILNKISNSSTGWSWDGTYNGIALPSSDYWYSILYKNGKILKGHFSLKR
ncbi:T9SS type B sorting domain-containing protein, partial [Winogradskyella echinorum]